MFNTQNNDDINVEDLVHTHNRRKNTRQKIYDEIYSKCVHKIKYINDILLEKECYFSIPSFRWGLPFYQRRAALGYIMIKLRGKGFDVHYVNKGVEYDQDPYQQYGDTNADTIYINWNKLVESVMNDKYPARQLNADGIDMDIADTTVPKPSNVNVKDDRFTKLETEGCGGECCEVKKIQSRDPERKRITKKQKLEMARQQQQNRIQNMLKYKNY